MEDKTINPSCRTCNYFIQHYAIIGTAFHPIHCGHCTNRELTPKERRSFPFTHGCGLWVSNKEKKEERLKSIEFVIGNIEEHLNYIKQILKFDKQ